MSGTENLVPWLEDWPLLPVSAGQSRLAAAEAFAADIEHRSQQGGLFRSDDAILLLRREPWDCDQLGLEAGKLEWFVARSRSAAVRIAQEAVEAARQRGFLHLSCRLDSRDLIGMAALQQIGFYLVDAVVTLAIQRPLQWKPTPATIRRAGAQDREAISQISGDCFATPGESFNRYVNDPYLPLAAVRQVYSHWARTSIGGAAADLTLVCERQGEIAGFLTLKLLSDGFWRVRLNAIAPHWRKQGIYRDLVIAGLAEAWEAGARSVDVITQVQQVAVQRTWSQLGALVTGSALTWNTWLGDPLQAR